VTEAENPQQPPKALLETLSNLSRFHREHEKFYSQAPLRAATDIHAHSRALKALAARWTEVEPTEHAVANPFAGAEDLNAPGLVSESGILFMEGEQEPAEIKKLKGDLEGVAATAVGERRPRHLGCAESARVESSSGTPGKDRGIAPETPDRAVDPEEQLPEKLRDGRDRLQ
jgi:hypothetical protein